MNEHARRPGGTAPLAGRSVARIGYGVMQLAERGNRPALPAGAAEQVLRRAVELGVDHLDTAQFYGAGLANELIRAALHPYPDGVALVTKVGAERDPDGALVAAQRPAQLRAAVEENLRSLDVDRLAVVNLRRLDARPGILATGDQVVDLDSQLAELVALRDEGKLGGIGLSNVSREQLGAALPAGIACVQNYYNVLERDAEPVLELCREQGIAWVPFCPLGSAFPGAVRVDENPAVRAAASGLGATPAQVGLAWLLGHAPNVLLIAGTSSRAHLEENVAAGGIRLDAGTTSVLDRLA